ncbi:MAG TPA: FimV/HubP family polar landmark protein, partial [Rhodanobacteraceae bacterium]|nr:FimV/HubP family polar landmark protein [Rhodanobacteraceae bacterium]
VNALKAGAILRIPTRQEALAISRRAAIAAVRQQNQTWQSEHAASPTLVASSGGSSKPVIGAGAGASGGDHLALVPPEAGNGGGTAGGTASGSQLRQELARSQEALSSQKQAAADLTSRVSALEQLQDKNKRLLNLKNAEIAALQDKLADARKSAGLPALPTSTTQAGALTVAPESAASVAGASSVAATSAIAGSVQKKTTKPASAVKHQAPSTSSAASRAATSAPWYEQMWVRIGLAVLIVLLIVWAFLRRRKPKHRHGKPSVAEHFSESPLGPTAGAAAELGDEGDDEAAYAPEADEDGEHELLAQLAEHPDDVGLHLELVSLYYARGDADQFEAAAEAMHAYVDDESQPEWQEVLAMGRELAPDHPLFVTSTIEEVAPGEAPRDFLDTTHGDTFGDAVEDTHVTAPADDASDAASSGYSFDFDLTAGPSTHQDEVDVAEHDEAETPDALTGGMPDESEFDALPPLSSDTDESLSHDEGFEMTEPSSASTSHHLADELSTDAADFAKSGFSDDPVDTKLDLARAYIDMGDHEGARAMLHEALHEGSQMQKEAAQKLLDELD